MYEFVDTNQEQEASNRLPSEALIINGQAIEDQIDGYSTLSVSGRELIGKEITAQPRTGANGDLYLGSKYPARTIEIEYKLDANDNEDFREKFEQLNELLQKEQSELMFNDDKGYSYTGTLSDVGAVPKGRNNVIGTFSFYCNDPFKYDVGQWIEGESPLQIYLKSPYEILPTTIIVTPDITTSLDLNMGDKLIRLRDIPTTKDITLDFENQEVRSGSTSLLDKMTLNSDFENFYLLDDRPMIISGGGNIRVFVKQVKL